MKKIVIAGGTGFIGNYLSRKFGEQGYEVKIISRQVPYISWNDKAAIAEAVGNAEMLINLAGKSVDCRYNEKNKKEIFDSRIDTTKLLGEAVAACAYPPPLWINSGTATIYRHAQDRPMTETTGEIGAGFSVNVATAWEKSFFGFHLPHTRQVVLRMAIVLGKDGGVMLPLSRLVKAGLGGRQGTGEQMFSWLHVEDLYRIILFVQQEKTLEGVINAAAPNPVQNKMLMRLLRKYMHRGFGLPLPRWLLKIGAVLIKTETELVLKSRWVIPEKLLQHGYLFRYKLLEDAVKELTVTK